MNTNIKRLVNSIFEVDNAMLNLISIIESGKDSFLMYNIDKTLPPEKIDHRQGIPVSFSKKESGNYEIRFKVNKTRAASLDTDDFFVKPTLLITKGVSIMIYNFDVKNIVASISEKDEFREYKVEINAFRGDVKDDLWLDSIQNAFFKVDNNVFSRYKSGVIFDMTTDKDQHSNHKNALKLSINKHDILFYYQQTVKNDYFLTFKTQNNINHNEFKRITEATRVAIGLISGYLPGENVYFFAGKRGEGIKSLTYKYRNLQETIHNKYPILDYRRYENIVESELKLSSEQFNNLVNYIFQNEEIQRAAMLLITAGTVSGVSKGSLASVALETITGIMTQKQKANCIITDTEIKSKLKHELSKGLKTVKDLIPVESFTMLNNKLSQINNLPNANKLEMPFETYGISLNEEDKYCMNSRNKFLHGVLPENKKLRFLTEEERVFYVSNRLMMLSSMLLLRVAKYEGKVIDWGYTEVAKKRMILNGERANMGNHLRNIIGDDDYSDNE